MYAKPRVREHANSLALTSDGLLIVGVAREAAAAPRGCVVRSRADMRTNDPAATLGQQIRDARIDAGHSLRAVARELDLSPSYMNDIEHDRRVPSEAVLRQLATHLDLDADRILAAAGRVGEGAERFLKANPTAGVLFRRVSDAGLAEDQLKRLLAQAEKMISKRDDDQSD